MEKKVGRISLAERLDVDLKHFRLSRIWEPQYRYMLLVLWWPLYGLAFGYVERGYPVEEYTVIHCALDEQIPFLEGFFIPYMLWFLLVSLPLIYGFFFDTRAAVRMMYYIMFTYTLTIVIYLIWPTMQDLRPVVIPRDNLLTRFALRFYAYDTNTNVCPSIHVLGAFAGMHGCMEMGKWKNPVVKKCWDIGFAVLAVVITVSTVFVKQHSVIDVVAALPLCMMARQLFYGVRSSHVENDSRRKKIVYN
ncbi:MAG: phosphatidic acid phosphatase [Lachnospiraceae bacterium]|nr:phosphatidic acid phosphatase [Lachnospiraceae bacterium]